MNLDYIINFSNFFNGKNVQITFIYIYIFFKYFQMNTYKIRSTFCVIDIICLNFAI